MCTQKSTDSRQRAADDSLLAMLTSNKLQEIATPRSRDPLSSSAAAGYSLGAKAGGLDWCAPASKLPAIQRIDTRPKSSMYHDYA